MSLGYDCYHFVSQMLDHLSQCYYPNSIFKVLCLQCFDTVGWVTDRTFGLQEIEWWYAGLVICLE